MKGMFAIARVELLRLLRSRMTFTLLMLVPALQLVLFGYAIAPSSRLVTVAVAAPSLGEADNFVSQLSREPHVSIVAQSGHPGTAEALALSGMALVGVELPVRRSADNPDVPVLPIRVTIDASDAPMAETAILRIEAIYWRQRAEAARDGERPALHIKKLHNPDLRDNWTFLPALSGVTMMIAMLLLGCLSIAREREGGTWETFLTLPIHPLAAVFGRLLPGTVIGTVQGISVILIGHWLFDLPLHGNVMALFFVMVPLFAAAHLALGQAISARAASQLAALQGAVALYLPAMLLSGFIYSLDAMPHWAQHLGALFPLTHFIRAARGVLLRGDGALAILASSWPVALALITAIGLTLLAGRSKT